MPVVVAFSVLKALHFEGELQAHFRDFGARGFGHGGIACAIFTQKLEADDLVF